MRLAALVLLLSCAAPHGPWIVYQGTEEQQEQATRLAAAVSAVTGDPYDYIAHGGQIVMSTDLDGACPVPEGMHVAGCNYGSVIYVRVDGVRFPDLQHSALAHEFCHGALGTCDEVRVDACAVKVQSWL